MSRIEYPVTFADEQTLLTAIFTRHEELGAKSPLNPFAKQQKWDLALLKESIQTSAEQNDKSKQLSRDSENETQLRNNELKTPWEHQLAEAGFLKTFFAGNEKALGEWGITVDGAHNRLVYPTGVPAQVKLIQTFLAKHKSYAPGESPLQWYIDEHEINIDADLESAAQALKDDSLRDTMTGDSELATQTRDQLWTPAVTMIHLFGAFLMGLYHEDSRKMAAWGYKVVEDGSKEVLQTSDLLPLEKRTTKGVVIGSVFTNAGEDVLQVQNGEMIDEHAVTVQPKGELGMTKGYSVITVLNPSSLKAGKYTVMVHR